MSWELVAREKLKPAFSYSWYLKACPLHSMGVEWMDPALHGSHLPQRMAQELLLTPVAIVCLYFCTNQQFLSQLRKLCLCVENSLSVGIVRSPGSICSWSSRHRRSWVEAEQQSDCSRNPRNPNPKRWTHTAWNAWIDAMDLMIMISCSISIVYV